MELIEQRLGVLQVQRVETLGEPAIDRREKVVRQMHFVEHGLSPEPGVQKWQNRLIPLWRDCSGGCHLDRKTDDLIRAAGLSTGLSTGYAHGPRPIVFMHEGSAAPHAIG
jgi:hypothetical protein